MWWAFRHNLHVSLCRTNTTLSTLPVHFFYVLLKVHPGMTLGKWPTWCTISLYNTFIIIILYMFRAGTAVAQWLRCYARNRKVARSIPAGVIGNFRWHKTLPIVLWPWGRLSIEQKWVPGAFPGGWKRPVRRADNLTTILCRCHEIWEP